MHWTLTCSNCNDTVTLYRLSEHYRLKLIVRCITINIGTSIYVFVIVLMLQDFSWWFLSHISCTPHIITHWNMQWQMEQVDKFCLKRKREDMALTLPQNTGTESALLRRHLFRHLIFDDKRQLIFSYIPKVTLWWAIYRATIIAVVKISDSVSGMYIIIMS